MITIDELRKLALSFEETIESPHFELTSFRINKKIFMTLDVKKKRAMIKLSMIDQSLFVDDKTIYPVPGAWGTKGATYFELEKVRPDVFKEALKVAYCSIAPKKLAEKYL
jgi:hypothetical protein